MQRVCKCPQHSRAVQSPPSWSAFSCHSRGRSSITGTPHGCASCPCSADGPLCRVARHTRRIAPAVAVMSSTAKAVMDAAFSCHGDAAARVNGTEVLPATTGAVAGGGWDGGVGMLPRGGWARTGGGAPVIDSDGPETPGAGGANGTASGAGGRLGTPGMLA